jgi:hypothetical protein
MGQPRMGGSKELWSPEKQYSRPIERDTSDLYSCHMRIFMETGHLSAESLGLHVLGDLSIFGRTRVESHLSGCSHCRGRFREEAKVIAAFRTGAFGESDFPQTARTA